MIESTWLSKIFNVTSKHLTLTNISATGVTMSDLLLRCSCHRTQLKLFYKENTGIGKYWTDLVLPDFFLSPVYAEDTQNLLLCKLLQNIHFKILSQLKYGQILWVNVSLFPLNRNEFKRPCLQCAGSLQLSLKLREVSHWRSRIRIAEYKLWKDSLRRWWGGL